MTDTRLVCQPGDVMATIDSLTDTVELVTVDYVTTNLIVADGHEFSRQGREMFADTHNLRLAPATDDMKHRADMGRRQHVAYRLAAQIEAEAAMLSWEQIERIKKALAEATGATWP